MRGFGLFKDFTIALGHGYYMKDKMVIHFFWVTCVSCEEKIRHCKNNFLKRPRNNHVFNGVLSEMMDCEFYHTCTQKVEVDGLLR